MKELEVFSKWFLACLGIITIFKGTELAFWLMNRKSTLQNIAGILFLGVLIAGISFIIIKKIKTK